MKIGIFTDLRFTELTTPTGVTKHVVQMVKGLFDNPNIELIMLCTKDQVDDNGKIPSNNELSYLEPRILPYSWKYLYWKSLFLNITFFDSYTEDLDWVYCPKNDLLPLRKTKYAVTFHGAHELDQSYPNPTGIMHCLNKLRSRTHYKKMLKQATKILTVSEFLKQKTIEWFSAESDKIVIVGNGVENEFYNLKDDYDSKGHLIAVGGLNLLDGGDHIIKIAHRLKELGDDREIFIAGNQHEPDLLEKSKALVNIKLLGYLHKNELAKKMSNASLLLFLTRYETFGIAAAEAMAVGIPVITTKSTAVPEIVKKAGIYVDIESLKDLSVEFLNRSDYENNISMGKKIAANYKWSSCVDRLVKELN